MKHMTPEEKQDFLMLPDGQELYFQVTRPPQPKDILVLVHGLGDHCGRYKEFSNFLAKKGWGIYRYDQRGHGKTPGVRSFANSIEELIQDLHFFIQMVHRKEGDTPVFLFGHSFGAQVAINLLARNPKEVKGFILSSPNIKLSLQVSWLKRFIGRLASYFLPTFSIPNGIDPKVLTHDREIVEAYLKDPLVQNNITLKLGAELLDNLPMVLSLATKMQTPSLIIHGGDDKISSPEASREFYEKMDHLADRTLKIYPGLFHETLNEKGREKVFRDIEKWLEARA